jgi:hypothetical protein
MPGTIFRRRTQISNPTCLLGFSGRDSVDSGVFDSSTLQPGGIDEVQTLTITGATGGTFTLTYKGQTTAPLAYNASAATIQAALRGLSRLGSGVTVTGAGPYVITFSGAKVGKQDVPLITTNAAALTPGGSTASVVETTKGDSTFANLYVLRSGLPVMASADGKKLVEWDGASSATLRGIFDGQRELLGQGDDPIIPVYNHECVFDIAVVKNYTTFKANYDAWAAAHACQFKSQGT